MVKDLKYEDVTENINKLFEKVKNEYFGDMDGATFKLVYRTNRKGKKNCSLVFAEICSTSDLMKFLTADLVDSEEGLNYVIIIDKNVFEKLEEPDQIRILRHELRHCAIDVNDKTGEISYLIRKHTIEDFYEDVEIESKDDGDSRWKERIYTIGESIYEELDQEKKNKKKSKKNK